MCQFPFSHDLSGSGVEHYQKENEDVLISLRVVCMVKCPDYGGVLISEGVVLCTGFNGVELGTEDVSLLERCPLLGTLYH